MRYARIFAGILFALLTASCAEKKQDPPARIVHAITPNIDGDTAAAAALRSLMSWTASGEDGDVEAVIFTGDFGLTRSAETPPVAAPSTKPGAARSAVARTPQDTSTPLPARDLQTRAKVVADILRSARPGIPIFVLPAGRSIGPGKLPSQALSEGQGAIAAIQLQLGSSSGGPSLIDLSKCYSAAPQNTSQCVGKLPGRGLRIVGYPVFALGATAPSADVIADQDKWLKIFQQMMISPESEGRTILIAPLSSPMGTQLGSDSARKTWMEAAKTATVAIGVVLPRPTLRSQYELQQYWREEGLEGNWILAPPLFTPSAGMRSSQGASVLSLTSEGEIKQRNYWYAPGASAFRAGFRGAESGSGPPSTRERLFRLGVLDDLTRWSVLLIALLAAFLTAVAVWQIPPSDVKTTVAFTTGAADPGTGEPSGTSTTVKIPQALLDKWAPASFLQQNFTRTVLSGLGGLAVATLTLDPASDRSKGDAQAFYLVWFIVWFFVLLFASSLLRAIAEGVRSLVYIGLPKAKRSVRGWFTRFFWFFLTSVDAFMNLLQGKNELKSVFWAEEIRKLQEDALIAIDRVCENIQSELIGELNRQLAAASGGANPPKPPSVVDIDDVRVAVSVLADDSRRAYYISRSAKSAGRDFGTDTVAFIAVAGSLTRWWTSAYAQDAKTIVILAEDRKDLTLKAPRMLSDHFTGRAEDYKSFIVFPIPLREADPGHRAGLHISFKEADYLAMLWPKVKANDVAGNRASLYAGSGQLLDDSTATNRLIKQSGSIIQSLLRNFNERVFETAQLPRRRA